MLIFSTFLKKVRNFGFFMTMIVVAHEDFEISKESVQFAGRYRPKIGRLGMNRK